ncbi:anti-sigma factor family protein [Tritonibacter mobilis]|uniref:anti-sigma factor family protein n=1 Tax=Tritonibacter mobilis TaxID=379347 RepID=UPI0039A65753
MNQDHIPDEVLMAYADGELPADEAAALEARLSEDADLAARVQVFSASAAALQGLKHADTPATMPAGLEQALRARVASASAVDAPAMVAADPVPAGNVVAFPQRRVPLWTGALAATVALAVGLGAGLLAGKGTGPSGGADPVFAALDSLPSGEATTLADGTELRMVASFNSSDGALCREYEQIGQNATGQLTIACRDQGAWVPQLVVALGGAEGYAPASAPELLDLYYMQSEAGSVLPPEEERAALAALARN